MSRQHSIVSSRAMNRAGRRGMPLRLEILEERCVPSTISGYVYSDLNNNGQRDQGEPAISNSQIELRNAQNVVVGSAITDFNGYYQFQHDGTVSSQPQSITRTAAVAPTTTNWTRTLTIQPFDTSLGQLTSVEIINTGSLTSSIKVESLDGASSTITATASGSITLNGPGASNVGFNLASSSKVFNASAYDGSIDFLGGSGTDFGAQTGSGQRNLVISSISELALFTGSLPLTYTQSAVATSSASGAGNLISQINTTAQAQLQLVYRYIPDNGLKPGPYVIIQKVQPNGFFDGRESSNGSKLPTPPGSDTIPVNLVGVDVPNNDFGELQPASIGGKVYVDNNNNGIQDVGEQPLAGVSIALTGTTDTGPVALQVSTLSDGSYAFTNLRPGTYGVQESQPTGYISGKNSLGSVGGTPGTDQFTGVTLNGGAIGTQYNFGELLPASISGSVYLDANNNGLRDVGETGIASVTIELVGTSDSGAVQTSVLTDGAGNYQIANLRPGTYQLLEIQPAGYADGRESLGSIGGAVGSDSFSSIGIAMGAQGVGYNFGELLPASISGFVYLDGNNNGIKEGNESGIRGVTVALTGTDDLGQFVTRTLQTDEAGFYKFADLRPGVYSVAETQPTAYLDGKTTVGSNGGTLATNQILSVTLGMGTQATQYNFGELVQPNSTGVIYADYYGLNSAIGLVIGGAPLLPIFTKSQLVQGGITSTDAMMVNARFVRGVYRVILDREANDDPMGLLAWSEQLARGASREAVVLSILQSEENRRRQVSTMYRELLGATLDADGRQDPSGMRTWLNAFASGKSTLEVAQLILLAGFQGLDNGKFVDALYQRVLDRAADANGLAYWRGQLDQGLMSRAAVATSFISSTESYRSIVRQAYESVLKRSADEGGVNYWTSQLSQGRLSTNGIIAAFVGSQEFRNKRLNLA